MFWYTHIYLWFSHHCSYLASLENCKKKIICQVKEWKECFFQESFNEVHFTELSANTNGTQVLCETPDTVRRMNWRKITSFVNGNLHTLSQCWISLWPLGGDNVLTRSTNSYSSTTPSRSGSQTATKPVVGAECRFKVAGLCQPTMSGTQAYRQGPHYVKGLRAALEGWLTALNIDYPTLRTLTSKSGCRYYHDKIILIVWYGWG